MEFKRAFRRSEISLRCPCRTLDGVPLEIELLDLSERGCRARTIGFMLHVGQALRLFPEGCDAFTATIRRSDGELCGIEFDRQLPPPVFERMRSYTPQPGPDEDAQLDIAPESAPPFETAPEPVAPPALKAAPQAYGSLLSSGKKPGSKKKMAIS